MYAADSLERPVDDWIWRIPGDANSLISWHPPWSRCPRPRASASLVGSALAVPFSALAAAAPSAAALAIGRARRTGGGGGCSGLLLVGLGPSAFGVPFILAASADAFASAWALVPAPSAPPAGEKGGALRPFLRSQRTRRFRGDEVGALRPILVRHGGRALRHGNRGEGAGDQGNDQLVHVRSSGVGLIDGPLLWSKDDVDSDTVRAATGRCNPPPA